LILFIIIYDNKLQLSNREMEKQKQITCNDDESVVPTYNEHTNTTQKRPRDGSDGSDDDSDGGSDAGSDVITRQKRPHDDSDDSDNDSDYDIDGPKRPCYDDSDDDSSNSDDSDAADGYASVRYYSIEKNYSNTINTLRAHSGNPQYPEDPEDLRKKKELSNALLKAKRAVVDTYTTLIEVYGDTEITMEQFDELLALSSSQYDLFVSKTRAILDFIGEK
jgi:hypothetical protein